MFYFFSKVKMAGSVVLGMLLTRIFVLPPNLITYLLESFTPARQLVGRVFISNKPCRMGTY